MFDGAQEAVLREAVAGRRNLLVTGAGGTGKTTLLAALLGEAPSASASCSSRTSPSSRSHIRTSSRSRRGRRTSRAPGGSGSTRCCARRCGCAPTGSSSASAVGPSCASCSPPSTPATTAAPARCTPTRSPTCRRGSRRSARPPGLSPEAVARQTVSAFDLVLHLERVRRAPPARRDRAVRAPRRPARGGRTVMASHRSAQRGIRCARRAGATDAAGSSRRACTRSARGPAPATRYGRRGATRSRSWPSVSPCSSPPACPRPPRGRTSAAVRDRPTTVVAAMAPRRRAPRRRLTPARAVAIRGRPARRRPRARRGRRRPPRRASRWRRPSRGACDRSGVGRPVGRARRGLGGRGGARARRSRRASASSVRRSATRRSCGARSRSALAGPVASARLVLALPLIAMLFGARARLRHVRRALRQPARAGLPRRRRRPPLGRPALERRARGACDTRRGRRRPRTRAARDRHVGRRLGRPGAAARPRRRSRRTVAATDGELRQTTSSPWPPAPAPRSPSCSAPRPPASDGSRAPTAPPEPPRSVCA